MSAYEAVKVTIDLVHVPSRVRHQRSLPLPAGVLIVLGIAAGDEGALSEASTAIDRPRELIRKAAAFFIEQILLSPDADSYRVLGANRTATAASSDTTWPCSSGLCILMPASKIRDRSLQDA